jgi:5-(carboxyamino)imidazole ribonucleotide mutase
MDSLLSIVEMPNGSPVATVGVNKAANAGLYAIKILATEFSELRPKLKKFKERQHHSVLAESDELKKSGLAKFVAKKFK